MKVQAPWVKPAAWGCGRRRYRDYDCWLFAVGLDPRQHRRAAGGRTNQRGPIVALTPSCVARFMQQPGAAAKLAEFQKIESWNQRQFIEGVGQEHSPAVPRVERSSGADPPELENANRG